MNSDSQLKEILHIAVNHAVSRMEALKDPSDRRCIFQEYKEWMGSSIDDWVLALPDNWGKSDSTFY